MKLSGKHMLGLALGQGAITVSQAHLAGREPRITRRATFVLPEAITPDQAAPLGAQLARFLREEQFTARRAVIGLPASWLIVRPCTVPRAEQGAMLDMLRLLAEREFAGDARDLAFECILNSASPRDAEDPAMQPVLLLAMMRKRLAALETMMGSAGLTLQAVTASTVVLAQRDDAPHSALWLRIMPGEVEMLWRDRGRIGAVKHLTVTGPGNDGGDAAWAQSLAGELFRATVALPIANGSSPPVHLLDEANLSAPALEVLKQRLALPMPSSDGERGHDASAMADALALAGLQAPRLLVDFKHSRLALPPSRMPALWRYGLIAAAVLLLAVTALAGDILLTRHRLQQAQHEYAAIETVARQAGDMRDRVRFARGWYDQRPPLLTAMAAITRAFPAQGTVWANNLSLRDDLSGTVTGKAESESEVLMVLREMGGSPHFDEVKLLYLREADRQARQVMFSIQFQLTPQVGNGQE